MVSITLVYISVPICTHTGRLYVFKRKHLETLLFNVHDRKHNLKMHVVGKINSQLKKV